MNLRIVAAFLLFAPALWPQSATRRIAVTFDDLPAVSFAQPCSEAALRSTTERLLGALKRFDIPVTGFVNEGRLSRCEGLPEGVLEDLLSLWAAAGHDLGNHSYSHFDINDTPVEKVAADIRRGEAVTRRVLSRYGKELRYFRHPFLHTGPTEEIRKAYAEAVAGLGYEVAPVTIDNEDWVFAAVYARAKAAGDRERMEQTADAYLTHIEESIAFYEQYSRQVFGREIAQILLVHANELNADHFGRIAEQIRIRGYRFVRLAEALEDRAYASEGGYTGPWGLSWLERWALTQGHRRARPPSAPEFIQEWLRQSRSP